MPINKGRKIIKDLVGNQVRLSQFYETDLISRSSLIFRAQSRRFCLALRTMILRLYESGLSSSTCHFVPTTEREADPSLLGWVSPVPVTSGITRPARISPLASVRGDRIITEPGRDWIVRTRRHWSREMMKCSRRMSHERREIAPYKLINWSFSILLNWNQYIGTKKQ